MTRLRLTIIAVIALFVLSPMTMTASAVDLDILVLRLQDKYNNVSTVTAEFTQEVVSKSFGTRHVSTGRAYFKKPGRMRWAFLAPTRDELVSNGRKLWFYQPDLNQVIEKTVWPGGNIATDFLSGMGNLRRDFIVKLSAEDASGYVLELTPMVPQTSARKISLGIDRTDLTVRRTAVEDFFGNVTTVTFRDILFNVAMNDSIFEFKAPPGVEVIRQ